MLSTPGQELATGLQNTDCSWVTRWAGCVVTGGCGKGLVAGGGCGVGFCGKTPDPGWTEPVPGDSRQTQRWPKLSLSAAVVAPL